jgi:cytochrome c5
MPSIAQGKDTLFKHTIVGYTGKADVMHAKGGNAALSDEEVKAAVEHLIGLSK